MEAEYHRLMKERVYLKMEGNLDLFEQNCLVAEDRALYAKYLSEYIIEKNKAAHGSS